MLGVIAIIPVIGVVLSVLEGVVIGAVGSYSYYGSYALEGALIGSLGLLVFAACAWVVLGVFFKMFADIAVMHFAVAGRVESAFSLEKVWKSFKPNQSKLFCASIFPEFLTGIVSNVVTWILTVVFGASLGIVGMYTATILVLRVLRQSLRAVASRSLCSWCWLLLSRCFLRSLARCSSIAPLAIGRHAMPASGPTRIRTTS